MGRKIVVDYNLFLSGRCVDHKCRTVDDILCFNNYQLEHIHDYIQIMFPTSVQSQHSAVKPITEEELEALKHNNIALDNIRKMYSKMLNLWKMTDEELSDWECKRYWNKPGNHNHMRMTRLLQCFALLELVTEFADFSKRIQYIMNRPECRLGDKTREIWMVLVHAQIQVSEKR